MPSFIIPVWARYVGAILAVLAVLYGAYRHGVSTTNDRWQAKYNADIAAAHEATAKARAEVRGKELAAAQQQANIEAELLRRLDDAQSNADRIIADLRAGNLRLRSEFSKAVCAVAGVPDIAASAGQRDAACDGGFSEDHVRFLVQFAQRAQRVAEQLQAAQQVIINDRLICNGQAD